MDRRDPAGVHEVGVVAAEHLDLLVRELEPSLVPRGHARDRDLHPLLVEVGGPRLVEERQVEEPGPVGERDRDHRLAAGG